MRADLEREYVEYLRLRLPQLRKVAALLCGDVDRGDDVVQAAALTLYAKWKLVREADDMDAYVHRVVVNSFLRERRLRWSRVLLFDRLPDREAAPDQPVDERMAVRAALRRLPPRQQAVLVLRFLCDRPVADVAAILGCAEGTVRSQTSDGLRALRRQLAGWLMDRGMV